MTTHASSRAVWRIFPILALLALSARGAAAAECRGANLDFSECKAQCDRGDMAGCINLAAIYDNGIGVERNDDEIFRLFRLACDRAEGKLRLHACTNLGSMYMNGRGTKQDYQQSLVLFEMGCNGDNAIACVNLANQYERGLGVAADQARATRLYLQAAGTMRKLCDDNRLLACFPLAELYERGQGVAKDLSMARSLYEKACRGGWKPACAKAEKLPSN